VKLNAKDTANKIRILKHLQVVVAVSSDLTVRFGLYGPKSLDIATDVYQTFAESLIYWAPPKEGE
jgi:hypothetical protein